MTPDARPDVTALAELATTHAASLREVSACYPRDAMVPTNQAWRAYTAMMLDDLARRLTEQDAEIARLRNLDLASDYARDLFLSEIEELKAKLTAAEQALSAARRERDALNAAAIAILGEYGPPSEYDQPYRGIWLALQYAIRREPAA